MRTFPTLALLICLAVPLAAFSSTLRAETRPIIEKRDDLPRHTYQLTVPVADLYAPENRPALEALARRLADDVQADLDTFDIRDDNTVQEFYGVLGSTASLTGQWALYLDYLQKRRALETKEANRLTMGIVGEAVAQAQLDGGGTPDDVAVRLADIVSTLPYATVEANLESLKGRTEILSRALVLGSLDSNYQPVADRNNGVISYDVASSLVGAAFTLDQFLPAARAIGQQLQATLAANRVEKTDIWAARQLDLSRDAGAEPVVLAVWDSGVDTEIFASLGLLWHNDGETPDGHDNDNNGFVDDVHGIAYDLHATKVSQPLYRLSGIVDDPAALEALSKGLGDIQFNIDSPEATAVRQRMATLPQEDVEGFLEALSAYGNYSHGTHVAGIASEGNPFARILAARMTYGHTLIPEEPTLAQAHRDAAMFLEVVDYFRTQNVRVVNMSWGGSLRSIEGALEANAAGGDTTSRKALAREIYEIGDRALRRAIREAPQILFVTSAGNSDNDVRFDEFYPSSYEFPNLLTVGAVDIAGEETSFTSLGKVDIYANGFEVESYVPGGNRLPYSGTSMSSPQVTNLAGKLLALYPELSVAQLKRLILDGATEKALASRTIRLLHPAESLRIAAEGRVADGP